MAIFRIYGDDHHYLNFIIPGSKAIKKLGGRENPFHIDRTPKAYAHIWDGALEIDFHYGEQGENKPLPDIIENNGRLFLNSGAYSILKDMLFPWGELLPIAHKNGEGFIFNPLETAENRNAIDVSALVYDAHENLERFQFKDECIKEVAIFRTQLDTYLGLFCSEEFKTCVETAELKGILFGTNICSPVNA